MREGCIYCITNIINGNKYIGQTVNYKRRMQTHKYSRKRTSYIKRAIDKYGLKNFKFEILEKAKVSKLNEKEKQYIKEYNTFEGEGYNLTPGGDGLGKGENHWWYGKELSETTKSKISKANIGEKNGMYGITGEDHPSYHNSKINTNKAKKIIDYRIEGLSMGVIADKLNICSATVYKILRNKHWVSEELNKIYKNKLKKLNNKNEKQKTLDNLVVLKYDNYKNEKEDNFTVGEVKEIIEYKKNNLKATLKEMSEKFNRGGSTISRILNGKHKLTKVVKDE